MSRRNEPSVVVVERRPSRTERTLTQAEARKIRLEQAEALKLRRASGMRTRLRPQYGPWLAGFGVFALGGICWLVRWLVDPFTAILTAVMVAGCFAFAAFMAGRRTKKWAGHIYRAAGGASLWLLFVAAKGPSWDAPLIWMVGVIVASSGWWKANRIPHPKAPNREVVPEEGPQTVNGLWDLNIADKAGCLPGSWLSDKDTTQANCERWVINLRAGKQDHQQVLGLLVKIAGGLRVPVKQVVLEPHENEDPNQMLLTVVRVSPIDKTLTYAGARITGTARNIIEVGPYGDGDGMAPWRTWAPGEQPMTGSWLSGFIVGGTGIGKSRLMELLAAGYMATGYSIVWFADPQGGASSPTLREYADWYVDADGTPLMLSVLEAIAAGRELEMGVEGWSRFDPSPERPGIVVFLDECHVTFGKYGKRWADLARKAQKVGISFIGLTQYASLESLGGHEPLRAALLVNAIVMKAHSNMNKQLITGLEVNPESLPKIPGFGYVIGTDGTRTAPFRAEYLADPQVWFEQYEMPVLDALSAGAAGDPYTKRQETQAELQEKNRKKVAALRGGTYQPPLPTADVEDEPDESGAFQVPSVPAAITGPKVSSRDAILAAIGTGQVSTGAIAARIGLGKSQLFKLLGELVEEERIRQVSRGLYERIS